MNLKYFNILKATDKYTGNTTQFFAIVFGFLTLMSGILIVIKLPSDLIWYRCFIAILALCLFFTYLENKKENP